MYICVKAGETKTMYLQRVISQLTKQCCGLSYSGFCAVDQCYVCRCGVGLGVGGDVRVVCSLLKYLA